MRGRRAFQGASGASGPVNWMELPRLKDSPRSRERWFREVAALADFLLQAKVQVARFYADHILSKAPGVAHSIVAGHAATNAINVDLL